MAPTAGEARVPLSLDATREVVLKAEPAHRGCCLCSFCCCGGSGWARTKRRCACLFACACVVAACVAFRFAWIANLPQKQTLPDRASLYAKVAGASYCTSDQLLHWNCGLKCIPGVSDVHICQGDTTKAFVARWEGSCVVSIMGTQEYSAMLRDLQIYKTPTQWSGCKNCWVHDGFLSEWGSMDQCVRTSLEDISCPSGSAVRVTGHSLGGAISALAMMSLADAGWKIEEAYTFGMPRVGDETFARDFNLRFSNVFHRVTHHMDPIVHVPLEDVIMDHFRHAEPEVFFDGSVSEGFSTCHEDGDVKCSGQYSDLVLDVLHMSDHMSYMDIQIGTAGCGPGMLESRPEIA